MSVASLPSLLCALRAWEYALDVVELTVPVRLGTKEKLEFAEYADDAEDRTESCLYEKEDGCKVLSVCDRRIAYCDIPSLVQ